MATRKKRKSKHASAQPSGALGNVIETGQHIWLAGLGAVARAQREGPKLFEALVMEGSEFQDSTRENVQERSADLLNELRSKLDARTAGMRGKAAETMGNLEEILQARVLKALQQLGVPTSHEIEALSRKVNELNRSVQALTQTRSGNASGRKRAGAAAATAQQGAAV
ncbi:phasin family protein [Peristeroidobacter soli]|jgi:poly(hydroxyalkanoate) granule-associated protein|uniref:phasin family protein n=1 Tax=Peristeroidobacter soli TaxID=2497877 RepID=UPI00101DBC9B|nr:phasin family protein [Peristeroidobacter soli]